MTSPKKASPTKVSPKKKASPKASSPKAAPIKVKKSPKKEMKAKKAKAEKPKTDKPKRAPGAFMLFSKEKRPDVLAANPGIAFGDVGRKLGEMWGKLSDAEKAKYKS